jgi:GNAT superfamily N-acetyltransferase
MKGMNVRWMTSADLAAVADLCAQLGYPCSLGDLVRRFDRIRSEADHAMLVAQFEDETILGWIHVHPVHTLESDSYVEIGGLVVDERRRRQGAGRSLIAEAERWAREQGFGRIRVRSNIVRPEAHAFYPGVGYELVKTQHTYGRTL